MFSGQLVRTSNDQEPITEPVELPEEVYVDNIEKDKKAVTFKLDSASAEAYKNLGAGKLYLKLGKLDEAIVEFNKAIQINPSFRRGTLLARRCLFYQR